MSTLDETALLPFGKYSDAEERANRLTHGIGFVLSVLGTIYLVGSASSGPDQVRLLSCMVYAASLMAVYAMSTLSHGPFDSNWRKFFRSLDQGFIYFLITGSATPLAVTYLPSGISWLLLGSMWTVATVGFLAKVCFQHQVESVAVWVYVALGWMPILATPWIIEAAPRPALWWGLVAGLCYTFGTIFLVFDHRVRYFHAVWHLCVIAGSAVHFFVTLVYVAGGGNRIG